MTRTQAIDAVIAAARKWEAHTYGCEFARRAVSAAISGKDAVGACTCGLNQMISAFAALDSAPDDAPAAPEGEREALIQTLEATQLLSFEHTAASIIAAGWRRVPQGFCVVPIEPTPEMCEAGRMMEGPLGKEYAEAAYRAMLAAAQERADG